MARFSSIDGGILDGVSTTTLWTLRNRATEAKRSDGVIRDPLRGLKLSRRYVAPPMPFALSADEGVALAGGVAGVWVARIRPSVTLLEFG